MNFLELLKLCDDDPLRSHMRPGDTLTSTYFEGYLPWFEEYRRGDRSHHKNLAGMIENSLTEEEAFFILAYTSSYSSWINAKLRDGLELNSPCKKAFAEALDTALSKVKSFSGTVFRMDKPPGNYPDVLKWFESKKGKIFVVPYYLSTAQEDYENSEVVWKITTLPKESSGKDIGNLCQAPIEMEVLFERNSKFRIDDVDLVKKVVHLTEIKKTEKADFELVKVYHKNI